MESSGWAELAERVAAAPPEVWIGLSVGSLVLAVASLALMPRLLVALPVDVLERPLPGLRARLRSGSPAQRVKLLARNGLGLLMLLLGTVMLFVPGQGVLTILAGVVLTDLPGRHRVIVGLLRRPRIGLAVQRLRQRRGAPLLSGLPEPQAPTPHDPAP